MRGQAPNRKGRKINTFLVPQMLSVGSSERNRLPHRGATLVRISRHELFNGCEVFHVTPAVCMLCAICGSARIALRNLWIPSSRRNPWIAQGSSLRDLPILRTAPPAASGTSTGSIPPTILSRQFVVPIQNFCVVFNVQLCPLLSKFKYFVTAM